MRTITACIITKNEQEKIADAVESVSWCDEVLVIDTGITDMTGDIAEKLGAKIKKFKGKGSFDSWRNCGLKNAKGDWILYIDSDERVTPALRDEISELVNKQINKCSAFAIPRKNIIFGKEFKYGGQKPDYQKRLFYKEKLKKWEGEVHEEAVFEGKLGHLNSELIHLKHDNLHDMMSKTNDWSEIEAKLMYDADHPPMNIPRFASAMAREFWDKIVKKEGFRDGPEGIIYSLYQVFSKFVSYAKLWEMQENNK